MDPKLLALVRTYDGPHRATVQIDPPIYSANGIWRAWLMEIGDNFAHAVAGGKGYSSTEAINSLCQMRSIPTDATPDTVSDIETEES